MGTHLTVLSKSYLNGYQHDKVKMVFLVLWTKVASALDLNRQIKRTFNTIPFHGAFTSEAVKVAVLSD